MKDDYISRQAAIDALGVTKNATKYGSDHSGYDTRMLYEIQDTIEAITAADAVPVVRCRDCEFYIGIRRLCGLNKIRMFGDGFCSYGERKE